MNLTQSFHLLSIAATVIASVFFLLVGLSRIPKFQPFIIKNIFNRVFLKKVTLLKDYASNLNRIREWYNMDMQGAVMVQLIIQEREQFVFIRPQTTSDDKEMQRAIVLETFRVQYREWERSGRKNYKTAVWYVEENFLTRLIGYRKGKEDRRLSA